MELMDYINKHFKGNQSAFARAQGCTKQHVQKWLKSGCMVFDDLLVSPRRELKKEEEK